MELPAPSRSFGPFVRNEAGKIAVCWRNHGYVDTPSACSGEVHLPDIRFAGVRKCQVRLDEDRCFLGGFFIRVKA
jgi:hypothetical protein